jgi:hypothetical protein
MLRGRRILTAPTTKIRFRCLSRRLSRNASSRIWSRLRTWAMLAILKTWQRSTRIDRASLIESQPSTAATCLQNHMVPSRAAASNARPWANTKSILRVRCHTQTITFLTWRRLKDRKWNRIPIESNKRWSINTRWRMDHKHLLIRDIYCLRFWRKVIRSWQIRYMEEHNWLNLPNKMVGDTEFWTCLIANQKCLKLSKTLTQAEFKLQIPIKQLRIMGPVKYILRFLITKKT